VTSEVTDSTVAPFSDRLMMNFITTLIASGIGQYGYSLTSSPRHDLSVQYTRLIAKIGKYSNDGANILIEKGWMEQPPMAADRRDLAMEKLKNKSAPLESLLWSIAFPGFGQLLNHKFIKGLLFISLEILINIYSNFNQVIVLGFHGKTAEAITQKNYAWYMFYPCIYFFAICDASKDASGGQGVFAYLPLVCTTYFATTGVIFSPVFTLFGYLIRPLWLPILFIPVRLSIGAHIRWMLLKWYLSKLVDKGGL